MSNARIIDLSAIPKLVKSEGYKFISLISPEEIQLVMFNPLSGRVTFEQNFKKICDKIKSPITPPGRYKILLSDKLTKGYHADEFFVIKQSTALSENAKPIVTIEERFQKTENALSFESALSMNREIAELTSKQMYLLQQIADQQKLIEELEQEIAELESEETPLQEQQENPLVSTLKEYAPAIIAMLDRHTQPKEQTLQANAPKAPTVKPRVMVEPGSEKHIEIIKMLFNNQDFVNLGNQLQKVKAVNKEKFEQLMQEMNLTEESDAGTN